MSVKSLPPNISVGLEVYIKKNNKYLIHQRNKTKRILPGVWMAPGGHVELYEGIIEAARREVLEETGLTIKNIELKAVGVGHLQDINDLLYIYIFRADYTSGKLKTDPKDGNFEWLSAKQILKLKDLLQELKHILPHVFSKKKQVIYYKAVYDKGNHMIYFSIEKN